MPDNNRKTPSQSALTSVQVFAALGILIVFALFAAYVVSVASSGANDGVWARILVVFSSFEALGFAAAGLLLGQQINATTTKRLDKAEDRNATLSTELAAAERRATTLVEATLPALKTVRNQLNTERSATGTPTEASVVRDSAFRETAIELIEGAIAEVEAARATRP